MYIGTICSGLFHKAFYGIKALIHQAISVVLVHELNFSFSYSTFEQSIFSSSSSYSKASAYLF